MSILDDNKHEQKNIEKSKENAQKCVRIFRASESGKPSISQIVKKEFKVKRENEPRRKSFLKRLWELIKKGLIKVKTLIGTFVMVRDKSNTKKDVRPQEENNLQEEIKPEEMVRNTEETRPQDGASLETNGSLEDASEMLKGGGRKNEVDKDPLVEKFEKALAEKQAVKKLEKELEGLEASKIKMEKQDKNSKNRSYDKCNLDIARVKKEIYGYSREGKLELLKEKKQSIEKDINMLVGVNDREAKECADYMLPMLLNDLEKINEKIAELETGDTLQDEIEKRIQTLKQNEEDIKKALFGNKVDKIENIEKQIIDKKDKHLNSDKIGKWLLEQKKIETSQWQERLKAIS